MSFALAFGGINVALSFLALLVVRYSPTADLFFYTLTSLSVMLLVAECGTRTAIIGWASTSLLAFFILGWPVTLPYLLFFGVWPLFKAFLESRLFEQDLKRRALCMVIKAAIFIILFAVAYFVFKGMLLPFLPRLMQTYPWVKYVIFPAALLFFVLYDIILTIIYSEFLQKVAPVLRRRR